jgi:peptide chain release factor 3
MSFEYKGMLINLLDTPGHKDFAEDTYRTLTAVDSVVLVVDGVKGEEEQTRKLMEVCRMRNTPVICFINKLDREGRDPYDLLDEVETKLGIKVRPLSWPIGMGKGFKGVYNLYEKKLNLFSPSQRKLSDDRQVFENLDDPQLDALIGTGNANQLREDVDLIEGVYPDFDVNDYLEGKIAPVFFGSAVNNFGVNEMLDTFIKPMHREGYKFVGIALAITLVPRWIQGLPKLGGPPACRRRAGAWRVWPLAAGSPASSVPVA